jgi:hypothetical protein
MEEATIFVYFFHGYGNAFILTKMGWATIWAIFPQAHLVTLELSNHEIRVDGLKSVY